ncbi:hypothetical protein FDP41_010680 [Naegleria fowleri]|uniref:Uncharacterized protein n=1 Tax=Naegleria fowleri TaxID=5763 RepID=A0A6A5CE22_NAEFO|nr:uncharacterized protein FDP41_010680 [Naegleria fowleri]KAF0983615.1 hypothetical protein FDP41_010680 [Naegleria fowleri]
MDSLASFVPVSTLVNKALDRKYSEKTNMETQFQNMVIQLETLIEIFEKFDTNNRPVIYQYYNPMNEKPFFTAFKLHKHQEDPAVKISDSTFVLIDVLSL